MKIVMYHYVRHPDPDLPHFKYLHADEFERQLDWLSANFGFADIGHFQAIASGEAAPGKQAILTFDDGVHDHIRHVLPALKSRKLWGFFFVCSSPYRTGRLLDVHRIHLILGRLGGGALDALNKILRPEMFSDEERREFAFRPYASQTNEDNVDKFKRILNYYISYEWRNDVLSQLIKSTFNCDESVIARDYYISIDEILQLRDAGMIIGSHSDSHRVFSRLPPEEQRSEILLTQDFLSEILGEPPTSFCYPYGGSHTFTNDTQNILSESGVSLGFSVEYRDAGTEDFRSNRLALPRYDCNQFPHGQVHSLME